LEVLKEQKLFYTEGGGVCKTPCVNELDREGVRGEEARDCGHGSSPCFGSFEIFGNYLPGKCRKPGIEEIVPTISMLS
jgi:hypothetical protein